LPRELIPQKLDGVGQRVAERIDFAAATTSDSWTGSHKPLWAVTLAPVLGARRAVTTQIVIGEK